MHAGEDNITAEHVDFWLANMFLGGWVLVLGDVAEVNQVDINHVKDVLKTYIKS